LLPCQISLVREVAPGVVRFAGALISLGVGIAVLSGQGLAHAETSDGSSESSTGSSSAGGSPAADDESAALSDPEPEESDVADDAADDFDGSSQLRV